MIHLLPHGDLRDQVMGKTARDPTDEELTKMRELAEQAMRDGAYGMSTGLIYVPGTYSKTPELIEVAKVVGRYGGIYASHIRSEGSELLDAVREAITIGQEAHLPVHVSHFKASGTEAWGTLHVAADLIEKARQSGQRVTADQYPYIASSTSLDATLLPTWSREGGRKDLEARLADPEQRAKIRDALDKKLQRKTRVQIASCKYRREWVGKSLDEIAEMERRDIADIVIEIESHGGAKVVNFSMQEEDMRMAMALPWVATASDGSSKVPDADQPHPRSYGTFTRKLGVYAVQEKVISLPAAVRSSSGLPADILSLPQRGYLREGYFADIAVFDPLTVRDRATFDQPYHFSVGMKYVFVNGVPAIYEETPTGALAGRVLAKEQSQTVAIENRPPNALP